MSLDHDGSHLDPGDQHGPGFYRFLVEDRLVQIVGLRNGVGHHNDDGTVVDARVRITVGVVEIATADVAGPVRLEDGCEVVAGRRILSTWHELTPATVNGMDRVLASKALPWCRATASRAAIVDRWVSGLPWHVPDSTSWEAADTAARWGIPGHARDLVRHGQRRRPRPLRRPPLIPRPSSRPRPRRRTG